ncbi:MAG: flagellar biosynthesis protein FlhB [Candidatus Kapabacteria bacterium]|nr:flagellar biosynthesis protein FlhB [Candidatus Kapabacteria bacterium]
MAKETPDGQEKTEDASARRLSDARDKGQVAKSVEVTSAALLLLGGWLVYAFGSSLTVDLMNFMRFMFRDAAEVTITDSSVPDYFLKLTVFLGMTLLPILGSLMLVGALSDIAQVGFHVATKKFTEGLNFGAVFNPFNGLKRIFFSKQSITELLKNIAKLLVLGGIVYQVIASHTDTLFTLMDMPFGAMAGFMAGTGFELVMKVGLVHALIAGADYFFQRRKYLEDLKMTKQEVKEENKQQEGDVQMKQRIRAAARQRLRKVMLRRVKEADVVITNPTHYAVALKYKHGEMNAPVVVAKGVDFLALKIREVATASNVPIVENPPLARALYAACEVEQSVPEKLFKAVAQVLAYVYRLKRRSA